MVNLENFFKPKNIAVIGASRDQNKVGSVILKNIIKGGFKGEVFPINPNADLILGKRAYPSVKKVEAKIDLAVVAIPAGKVLGVVKECKEKKISDLLIISSGFSEVGNNKLEGQLKEFLNKNKMRAIGVNCLGIFDAYNNLDTLFLPRYRLKRPAAGAISFVCQSGAIGSAILDIATDQGHKFSKFISYGNATDIDESDLLEYLGKDENTKAICLYVEGIKDGEKFYKTVKEVSKRKPIIALKGGLTEEGSKAALSHTGALAGKKEVFFGIFNQTGVINAGSLEEMFHIATLFEKNVKPKGGRVQIITNGGGYGIVAADNISKSKNLEMAKLSSQSEKLLKKSLPNTVNIRNPLDLMGDATNERYKAALEAGLNDSEIDVVLLMILYQTPLITENATDLIMEYEQKSGKPIVVVSTGGEFTESLSRRLERKGIATFSFPEDAINALDKVVWYNKKIRWIKRALKKKYIQS